METEIIPRKGVKRTIIVDVIEPIAHKVRKTDLRHYGESIRSAQPLSGNELIIDVLGQLVSHTQSAIRSSIGSEKKKHQFRLAQFKKAVGSIKECSDAICSGQQARQLSGIGKGIGDRIDEILETGTLAELAEKQPIDETSRIINELTTVTGIGEANAKKFIEQGVTSLADLRNKYHKGQIMLTHHMQIGLKYYKAFQQKIAHQEITELEGMIQSCVHQIYPDVLVEICGSYRREKSTSGDIDVLMTCQSIATEDDLIMSRIHHLKDIVRALKGIGFLVDDLTSQGDTKYMGVCLHPTIQIGRRIDIRFMTYDSYYPAILYFTGSMMLNKLMRTHALKKKFTLNEYGLFHDEQKIVVHSEKEIFNLLGLVYLEPNERDII